MWPTEVRGDLREALKAKYKADLSTSAAYLERYVFILSLILYAQKKTLVPGKQPKHYPLNSSNPNPTSKPPELPSV